MDCPACGGPVSRDVGPDRPPTTPLAEAILSADEDECVGVTQTCWNCGWQEDRQIRVTSITTSDGDLDVVARATLIDELTDELKAIDEVATLEDALGEIRRLRRIEPSVKDANEEPSE